jgi:hypothetical protein
MRRRLPSGEAIAALALLGGGSVVVVAWLGGLVVLGIAIAHRL